MTSKISDAIAAYIKLRDYKAKVKEKHSEELAPINEKMLKIEAFLLGKLNESGADNIKTSEGTTYTSIRDSVKIVDWAAFKKFAQDSDMIDMMEHRVSKDAVREFLEATGELPPGVAVSSEKCVRVRR